MLTKALVGLALVLVISAPAAFARKWTDSTGTHTIEAEFVEIVDVQEPSVEGSITDGKGGRLAAVRLKKQDGQIITVPLTKLSEEDQQFVKSTYSRHEGKRQPVNGNNEPKSAGSTRISLSRSASMQLDNAMMEGVGAYIRAQNAARPGEVTIYMGGRRAAKQERLEITIAGKVCEISHNWNWQATLTTPLSSIERHNAAPQYTCPRPSGSIRLTALTDLPLDEMTVAARSVLIRSGNTWAIVHTGEEGTGRNDTASSGKNDHEHPGTEAARHKSRSKAGKQESAQERDGPEPGDVMRDHK